MNNYDSIANLPLEERHEILRAWLNDLTTVYEKTAAERDAQMESASYLAGKLAEVDRERLALLDEVDALREVFLDKERLRRAANDYIAFVNSYEPSSFLRRENNGIYILLQAYADQFRNALDVYVPRRAEWPAQRLDDAARVTEES